MRTRIAVFALTLAALSVGAFALSQRALSIHARFTSGEDLDAGAPVRARGVAVGKLVGVKLDSDGTALAEIEIQKDAAAKIPADSVALLAPGGVDLILGDSPDPAGPDTVLKGYRSLTEFRLDTARSSANQLLDKLQADAEKLGKILQKKGARAGEVLHRELDTLRRELEKALPEGGDKDPPSKSI